MTHRDSQSFIIPLDAPLLRSQGLTYGLNSNTTASGGTSQRPSSLPLPAILPLNASIPPPPPPPAPSTETRGRLGRRGTRTPAARTKYSPPQLAIRLAYCMPTKQDPLPVVKTHTLDEVEAMINQGLRFYMNQEEVVMALKCQYSIEPEATRAVWEGMQQKMEEFFRAYEVRLRMKEQITAFNYLASRQAQMVEKATSTSTSATNPMLSNQSDVPQESHGFQPLSLPFAMQQNPSLPLVFSLSSLLEETSENSSTEATRSVSTNSLIDSFLKSSSDSIHPSFTTSSPSLSGSLTSEKFLFGSHNISTSMTAAASSASLTPSTNSLLEALSFSGNGPLRVSSLFNPPSLNNSLDGLFPELAASTDSVDFTGSNHFRD